MQLFLGSLIKVFPRQLCECLDSRNALFLPAYGKNKTNQKKATQQLSFPHLPVFLSALEQGCAEPRECRMSV